MAKIVLGHYITITRVALTGMILHAIVVHHPGVVVAGVFVPLGMSTLSGGHQLFIHLAATTCSGRYLLICIWRMQRNYLAAAT